MALTTITVNLATDENLQVSSNKKSSWLFPFTPIGIKSMRNPETVDALDLICHFNKGELFLLKEIKDNLKMNHEVIIKMSIHSTGDARKLASSINSFIKKGLLKRIRREHYMVNPYFLVPVKDKQQDLKTQWDSL